MNIDKAEELARKTEYAYLATNQDDNPINWGDAAAFFSEGFNYAKEIIIKELRKQENKGCDYDHPPTTYKDLLEKFNSITAPGHKEGR